MTRPLTPRQIDVIRLVAEGLPSATIGRQLHITEDTVKTVLRRAYARLGAVSRAHAVHLAYQTGILTVGHNPPARPSESHADGRGVPGGWDSIHNPGDDR